MCTRFVIAHIFYFTLAGSTGAVSAALLGLLSMFLLLNLKYWFGHVRFA